MLTKLRLVNFKSFADQSLKLRSLTLLSGLNGMGKSSVLQSLLALRQSYEQGMLAEPHNGESEQGALALNGNLVQLGTGRDVLFDGADREEIEIHLELQEGLMDTKAIFWRFEYARSGDVLQLLEAQTYFSTVEVPVGNGSQMVRLSNSVYDMNIFTRDFHYLQAERLGPRTSLPMSAHAVREQHQLGIHGEYGVHYLSAFGDALVNTPSLYHPNWVSNDEKPPLLRQLVELWLGEISPGTRLSITPISEIDAIRLSFGFVRKGFTTRDYRPTNVGFGLSYTLPILIALLGTAPSGLILLENPEAHLHPRGQVKMGELIARAASAGIQVLVETHSDHVLNGIRLAVKAGIVSPDKVALHFFQRPEEDDGASGVEVVTPELDSDGRIDFWPDGFFDEYGKALRGLL